MNLRDVRTWAQWCGEFEQTAPEVSVRHVSRPALTSWLQEAIPHHQLQIHNVTRHHFSPESDLDVEVERPVYLQIHWSTSTWSGWITCSTEYGPSEQLGPGCQLTLVERLPDEMDSPSDAYFSFRSFVTKYDVAWGWKISREYTEDIPFTECSRILRISWVGWDSSLESDEPPSKLNFRWDLTSDGSMQCDDLLSVSRAYVDTMVPDLSPWAIWTAIDHWPEQRRRAFLQFLIQGTA